MTVLLKQLFDLIKLLNSETGGRQIALGVVCGMILGFSPALSLQTLLVFLLLFFFRIQIGAAFATAAFFKLLAYPLDPLFDSAGRAVLETAALRPLFTELYNMPIIPLTRFNNSVVMGAGVIALALAVPVYFLANRLIDAYRERIVARFRNTAFWKGVQATSFYKWYLNYEKLQSFRR